MQYGGAAASSYGSRRQPPRHVFGEDRTLDYVVRQAEIIHRYEYLVAHLLDIRPPYVFGGDQTLQAWLEHQEAAIMAEALRLCDGHRLAAVTLVGESLRRHFGVDAQKRIAYAQRSFTEVAAERTGINYRMPPTRRRRRRAGDPAVRPRKDRDRL